MIGPAYAWQIAANQLNGRKISGWNKCIEEMLLRTGSVQEPALAITQIACSQHGVEYAMHVSNNQSMHLHAKG
jgi:hypothetical protein